jgi:hypothetical protein
MAADLSALSPYANDPDVVRYLQALQAGGTQPANSSTPFDAGLTSAYGTADTNYANTLAAINAQQPAIQRTYGFNESGEVDPSNPFGRAQLLQRSYQQSKRGTNNSMAARGQLYSGATQRALNDAQFNYQANDAALRNEYGQRLAELSAQRAVAANTRNDAKASAYWDWVQQQLQARAVNPAGEVPEAPAPIEPVAPAAAPAPANSAPAGATLGGQVGGGYAAPVGAGLGAAVGAPTGSSLGGMVGTPQGGGLGQYAGNQAVTNYLKALYAAANHMGSSIGSRIA